MHRVLGLQCSCSCVWRARHEVGGAWLRCVVDGRAVDIGGGGVHFSGSGRGCGGLVADFPV